MFRSGGISGKSASDNGRAGSSDGRLGMKLKKPNRCLRFDGTDSPARTGDPQIHNLVL